MKKIILACFVITLLFITLTGTCLTAVAGNIKKNSEQLQLTDAAGEGIIQGTITNQNGRPIAFVRVIAAGAPRDNATKLGFTWTHLINGIGEYSMKVPAGRYLFLRAGKLPLYLGAWAGPVVVTEGETTTLDLSITYLGPKDKTVFMPRIHNFNNGELLNLLLISFFHFFN